MQNPVQLGLQVEIATSPAHCFQLIDDNRAGSVDILTECLKKQVAVPLAGKPARVTSTGCQELADLRFKRMLQQRQTLRRGTHLQTGRRAMNGLPHVPLGTHNHTLAIPFPIPCMRLIGSHDMVGMIRYPCRGLSNQLLRLFNHLLGDQGDLRKNRLLRNPLEEHARNDILEHKPEDSAGNDSSENPDERGRKSSTGTKTAMQNHQWDG